MMSLHLGHQVTYFKRFRMEINLVDAPPVPALPAGYSWIPWNLTLLSEHAAVKYLSFQDEIDSLVFPNLGDRNGCLQLMNEIVRKPGFLGESTWLIATAHSFCGTVQGVCDSLGNGGIQNLGIVPSHRALGLGSALLLKALDGFRRNKVKKAFLEVTAQNEGALRMYRRLGFRRRKTIYKAVETADNNQLGRTQGYLAITL